jgi:DNA-binding transcriptional LysR family regulator
MLIMSRRQLDLDLLRSFAAIAATGSFRGAADRIGRTPSAISMQIQRLEETIGHRLLSRDRPPVRLTAQGETLLGYARRLLDLQAEALSAFDPNVAAGPVRFGIPDDYATGVLQPILARLAAEHPRIEIEITCGATAHLLPLLKDGALDLAVITYLPGRPRGQFLRHEPLVWAAAQNSACWRADPVPLAVFQPDCYARDIVTDAMEKIGRAYRIAYSSPNLAGLLAVTQAGLAVAALPRSSVPAGLKVLGRKDGFESLPVLDLCLVRGAKAKAPAIDAVAASVMETASRA